jgi:hypothetical protein
MCDRIFHPACISKRPTDFLKHISFLIIFSDRENVLDSKSDESIKPRKTKSITFRLDTMVVEELQRDADQGEISLNVLVNQVLRRYVEWDRYENKLGMMPIPKLMLATLIDETMQLAADAKITDLESYRAKIVNNAAQTALNVMKDSVLFMRKEYSFWTVLDVLRMYMKVAGIMSDHRIETGRKHVFIIQHELGENWSLFAKELLSKIFIELAEVRADISTTPKTVKAEVRL